MGFGSQWRESGCNAARPAPVYHVRRPFRTSRSDVDFGWRGRIAWNAVAEPARLLLPDAGSGEPDYLGIGDGGPRHRRPRLGRHPTMRHRLDGRLHAGRWRLAFARPPHRSFPTPAVDPVHDGGVDHRDYDRRALGLPPT